jgi:hypothetical protein
MEFAPTPRVTGLAEVVRASLTSHIEAVQAAYHPDVAHLRAAESLAQGEGEHVITRRSEPPLLTVPNHTELRCNG